MTGGRTRACPPDEGRGASSAPLAGARRRLRRATRTEASKIGGVTLQIVRDWVVKFNAPGPDGLVDEKAPRQAEPLPSKCPRQLALQPLQILRGHPRPSLLRLEQARQHALENHVHRNARLGFEVITTIGISPLSSTSRTGSSPSASTRGPYKQRHRIENAFCRLKDFRHIASSR